jgi:hypothetical protein
VDKPFDPAILAERVRQVGVAARTQGEEEVVRIPLRSPNKNPQAASGAAK